MKKFVVLFAVLCVALCALTTAQTPLPAATAASIPAYGPQSPHLRFAQITDTHIGILDNYDRTSRIVDAINSWPDKIDFVVHTGDITHEQTGGQVAVQARDLLAKLKPPLHYVPGNHDILDSSMCRAYRDTFGELSSRQEVDGVVCLFFFCEPLCRDVSADGYNPWTWLEGQLKQAAGKPVIIFMHTPTIPDLMSNLAHVGWPGQATRRFSDLVNSYNVKGVICGHLHVDKDYMLGKVPVFVCTSVSGLMGRHGFRVYEYKDGKLSYKEVAN